MQAKDKGLVWGLLEAAGDVNDGVRQTVASSLITLGHQHPPLVLTAIHKFISSPQTAPKVHVQSMLYNVAENIIRECGEKINDAEVISTWMDGAVKLLTLPSVAPDLQEAASGFMVALGSCPVHCNAVMECLVAQIQTGMLPSQSVIETLGALAAGNVTGTVPYYKIILGLLVGCLPAVKQESLKNAICVMINKFTEAILEAVENKEPDPNISLESYVTESAAIFELLVNLWIKNSTTSVRHEAILCLGHLSHLLPTDKLEELAGLVVTTILSMYRKTSCPYNLTFSLALIMDALIKKKITEGMRFHVDHLLSSLFTQVCVSPNYTEPFTVKNHYEVLRCYELLGGQYPENVVAHLLLRLENASYQQRVGSLMVIKHLINSKTLSAENVASLTTTLISILHDPNSKVVKSVTQVIVALCHNNHLTPQSGAPFITYLVKHSAGLPSPQTRRPSLAEPEEESVPVVCRRVLHLLATTVEAAFPLLWPLLLTFVCTTEHEASLPTTMGCLAHLAKTISEFNEQEPLLVGSPGPPTSPVLLSRLLVLSCTPGNDVGVSALTLLQGLASQVSPRVVEPWEKDLPQLLATLQDLTEKVDLEPSAIQMWHESLRDFLSDTITNIDSEEYTMNLGKAQMEQLHLYEKQPSQLCFLMSLIGITLKQSTSKTFIATNLTTLFNAMNHKSPSERENFALCVGTVAAVHGQLVLTHIDMWLKAADPAKKPISFFSLIKDTRAEECSWTRATLVQCLGQVAALTPSEADQNWVEGPIMLHLLNIINSNKSDNVNEAVLHTVSSIARARISQQGISLRQRPLLITHLINTIKPDNIPIHVLASTFQALRNLVALEPELNVEERTIILQSVLAAFMPRLAHVEIMDPLLIKCFAQLGVLMRTIIQKDTNPATLDDVTTLLQSWTVSPTDLIRIKSVELLHTTLKTYYDHVTFTVEGPTNFNQTCQLLAFLVPRVTDPSPLVRTQAVGSVYMVLRIAGRYTGLTPDHQDKDLNTIKAVEEQISGDDPRKIDALAEDVAQVISNKLSFVQLRSFLSCVVVGLQDRLPASSAGVALTLISVFTLRGHQLHQHIKELLELVYNRLEKVRDRETRQRAVEAVTRLSSHNLNQVLDVLLIYPLPYDKGVCETWHHIGRDPMLCSAALSFLIQVLERTQLFSEQPTTTEATVKIATIPPLAAISGLCELLHDLRVVKERESSEDSWEKVENSPREEHPQMWPASQEIIIDNFPSLASLLLLLYGSYVGVMAPLHQTSSANSKSAFNFIPNRGATTLVPSKIVLTCLQALIDVIDCASISNLLAAKIRDESDENMEIHLLTVSETIAMLVHESPKHIEKLVSCLDRQHPYEMQRMTVAAVFAQLTAEKCGGNYELLEKIIDCLLGRLNDRSVHVRRLAVRGLSNFAHLQNDQCYFPQWFSVSEKLKEIIAAMVGATDQRDTGSSEELSVESQVALEALRGLAALLPRLPQETVLQHTPTLLIRIRLFSEKTSGEVREAGLGVLRGLAAAVGSSEEFREHLHLHLLAALIHLADPHPPTVVMCKSALQALGPHVGSKDMNAMFQTHLIPSGQLNYHQFIVDLTKFMVLDLKDHIGFFIQATSSYFKSPEPSLRKAAALLIGNLVYHCEQREDLNISSVSHGLLYLMRDPDASVRTAAAIAIPLLFRHTQVL
ncbi:maestro heat-like repeat-containing protein family member 1 isoform X2 [Portunus trituberculatus]|uniref:maestro heat-like repeat-containing protein family member 1 isoform X2 n=1 Tax=Portunus trituberculatus TaxID=210409 RepID=UPI001E1D1C82|nr:maestro heat-like repeat-containing protein family member 1 isoform X2 [Portunus trituberculatus]